MAKIIKHQIKRSLPWLVVLGTISAMVIGLVFNFDLSFVYDVNEGLSISINGPQAQANSDQASTTLAVMNAAPQFTVGPSENPISSSTSPRNVGGTIRFTASSSDAESNSFYLIVCRSGGGVTASTTGGPPICSVPADTLCTSTLTAITGEAVCTYNGIADPGVGIESQAWWAYVCDNHTSQADCSPASQGAGDSGSPYYVNKAPNYTVITTTENNKNPGNVGDPFEVTATVTDIDVAGGADVLSIFVCREDSFATSTGCAGLTFCTGTSTSPGVSCTFATGTPADDDDFNYYAFVMDWHGFAGNNGNSRAGTYTVNNVAPTVGYGTTFLYSGGGATIQLDMRGNPEVYASTTSASVNDDNGCTDLANATSAIYWSSATDSYDCTADDDNCYQIGIANCVISDCDDVGDRTATVVCSTTLAFHAIPTDIANVNPNGGTDWRGAIKAIDDDGLWGVGTTTAGRDLDQLIALEVNELTIPYGTIRGGQNSGDANATTTILNYGNSPIDADVSGTDMDRNGGGGTIRDNNQEFNLTPFTYTGGTWNLSSTTPADVGITAPKPTTALLNVSDPIYWGIQVPVGTQSGDYYGQNTFTSTIDPSEW